MATSLWKIQDAVATLLPAQQNLTVKSTPTDDEAGPKCRGGGVEKTLEGWPRDCKSLQLANEPEYVVWAQG